MQDWGKGPSSEDLEKKVIEIKNHLKNKFGPQKGILPILIVIVLKSTPKKPASFSASASSRLSPIRGCTSSFLSESTGFTWRRPDACSRRNSAFVR
jgi:hypothetical protein